jgi:hypothetical protein
LELPHHALESAEQLERQDAAGVDWNCRIMPLKVLNSSNSGFYSWWAAAVDFAAANGADVINLSAGGSTTSTTFTNAIDNAINAGVIFVTITHNDGSGTVRYPGSLPQCITVGASGPTGVISGFSNYGTATDLVAPGGIGGSGGSYTTNMVATNLNGDNNWFWGTDECRDEEALRDRVVARPRHLVSRASIGTAVGRGRPRGLDGRWQPDRHSARGAPVLPEFDPALSRERAPAEQDGRTAA